VRLLVASPAPDGSAPDGFKVVIHGEVARSGA
jgi:hypothetical protein